MSRPLAAILASAALLAGLACGPAAAVDAVAGTQLTLHVGPGAEHRSLATVRAEERLTVHGCSEAEGWCLVRYDGRLGWVEGESLHVVGFSRRPADVAQPPAQHVVIVPVPVEPEPRPRFVTAEDVIVGVGEEFGLAVAGGRPALGLKKRHRGALAFKRHGFDRKGLVRHHGTFQHPRLDGRRIHSGKPVAFDGRRFGKHRTRFGNDFHIQRGRFGKPHSFASRGKGFHVQRAHFGKRFDHGARPGKRHADWHVAKRGRSFGHAGKVRFGGFRVKGGWRP